MWRVVPIGRVPCKCAAMQVRCDRCCGAVLLRCHSCVRPQAVVAALETAGFELKRTEMTGTNFYFSRLLEVRMRDLMPADT